MQFSGALNKMRNTHGDIVRYSLRLGSDLILVNDLLGKEISMKYTGSHQCFCGHEVSEVYQRNFCRDCFFTKPEASPTIMKPELSKAHLGIAERDLEVEKRIQLTPHYIYLAKTSGIKVGVTRATQMPYRWMDQGAVEATVLAEVPNRYLAGVGEVALKDHFADKTSWQRMLKNEVGPDSLNDAFALAASVLPEELKPYVKPAPEVLAIDYPVEAYPNAVKSLAFKPNFQEWSGVLRGIKGQYLILDQGVFNVRSHEGFNVEMQVY